MQILRQKIQSTAWIIVATVSFACASAWAGSAGDLQPRVPSDRMEQALSFTNPFTPTEEFIASGKNYMKARAVRLLPCIGGDRATDRRSNFSS